MASFKDYAADMHKEARRQGYKGEAVERLLTERAEQVRAGRENGETPGEALSRQINKRQGER